MRGTTIKSAVVKSSTGIIDSILHRVRVAKRNSLDRFRRISGAGRRLSIRDRQSELLAFYERYEELVETLCDGAQYGPTPKLEKVYAFEREWMGRNYASIRPYLISYLKKAPEDQKVGLTVSGRQIDAFEALVSAESLDELLQRDDGNMISRITRTREALTLYGEHLRRLAAR